MFDFISICCSAAFIYCSLYILIGKDVNERLPENRRVEWVWSAEIVLLKVHRLSREHIRLHPKGQKRNYFTPFSPLMFASAFAVPISMIFE